MQRKMFYQTKPFTKTVEKLNALQKQNTSTTHKICSIILFFIKLKSKFSCLQISKKRLGGSALTSFTFAFVTNVDIFVASAKASHRDFRNAAIRFLVAGQIFRIVAIVFA